MSFAPLHSRLSHGPVITSDILEGTQFYMSYEGLNLANQICQKLGVFERKFEGNHSCISL